MIPVLSAPEDSALLFFSLSHTCTQASVKECLLSPSQAWELASNCFYLQSYHNKALIFASSSDLLALPTPTQFLLSLES